MHAACFSHTAPETDALRREWDTVIGNGAALTLAVEQRLAHNSVRLVAVGAGVFVPDATVAALIEEQEPVLGMSLHSPGMMLLTPQQVSAANSGDGLNFYISHWAWAEHLLSPEQATHVRIYLTSRFLWFHLGYNVKQILVPALGEGPRRWAEAAGMKPLNEYRRHNCRSGDAMPCLLGISRAEVAEAEGHFISSALLYTRPRICFSDAEQQILRYARRGLTDEEISGTLSLGFGTVKKRWRDIYGRTLSVLPELLPPPGDAGRGLERRRVLLRYLDEHPEEIRPYGAAAKPKRRRAQAQEEAAP